MATMTAEARAEAIAELEEIASEIREQIDRAKATMRRVGGMAKRRAEAYWIQQVEGSLDGGSMCSLQDTIDELTSGEGD